MDHRDELTILVINNSAERFKVVRGCALCEMTLIPNVKINVLRVHIPVGQYAKH